MFNTLKKIWRRLAAALSLGVDKNTPPEVLVQQLMDEARDKDRLLHARVKNAISLVKQRQMNLDAAVKHRDQVQSDIDAGLQLISDAGGPDTTKGKGLTVGVETLGNELILAQSEVEQLMTEVTAEQSQAEMAKQAHKDMQVDYRARLARKRQTLAKIASSELNKAMGAVMSGLDDSLEDAASTSWDEIDSKVNALYADGLATQELAEGSVEGQMREIHRAAGDSQVKALLAARSKELGLKTFQSPELETQKEQSTTN